MIEGRQVKCSVQQERKMEERAWTGRRTFRIWAVLLTALLCVGPIMAQVGGEGAIEGTVTDPSGAVIPNATVTATNVGTAVKTERKSTSSGYFVLSPLDPGKYSVIVRANGFAGYEQKNITVNAIQTVGLKVQLKLGESSQTVMVTEEPPALETENATLGTTLEQSTYSALPINLSGGKRDPTAFIYLTPGVNTTAGTGVFDGSGSRGGDNEIYVEGIAIDKTKAQGDTGNISSVTSVDALEQMQVLTSSYPVEFQGQGVENYVVKSGTNELHGSVFGYFRNTALDTWNFFSKSVINPATGVPKKPQEHQAEYGLTIGGPIIKNKLFLFASYDGDHYSVESNPGTYTVPTAAARGGDFSAYSVPIYDPSTTGVCTAANTNHATCRYQYGYVYGGAPGPNGNPVLGPMGQTGVNVIPSSQISPISQALMAELPAPTNGNLTGNYIFGQPSANNAWNTTDKLSWTLNQHHTLALMVAAGRSYNSLPAFSGFQAPLPYGSATVSDTLTKTIVAEHTWVITNNMVNQLKYGFARNVPVTLNPTSTPKWAASSYGITGLPQGDASGSFPLISFGGTYAPTQWAGERASKQTTNAFVLLDNFQWTHGKHSITAGAQLQWLQDNEYNNTLNQSSPLQLSFQQAETAGYTGKGTVQSGTGLGFASFLVGAVDSSNLTENAVIETGARFRPFSPYFEDDYKLNPRLTINLGLRWDYYPPFYEVENRVSFFVPTMNNPLIDAPGGLVFGGDGTDSCHCRSTVSRFYKNFGPRVGAAYRISDSTVIRGGFGVMYSHGGGTGGTNGSDQGNGTLGFSSTPTISSTSAGVAAFDLSQGFPSYSHPPFLNSSLNTGYTTLSSTAPGNVNYADPYLGGRSPEYENWNVGIQQLFTNSIIMNLNYVGSQSHFLRTSGSRGYYSDQLNPNYFALGSLLNSTVTPAVLAQANAIMPGIALPYTSYSGTLQQMLRPFPQYTGVSDTYGNVGNANYHALQVTVKQQHPVHGLTFMASFTWSKMIDDQGNFRSGWLPSRIERSPGTAEQPKVGVGTVVYALPFGRGHIGNGNAWARILASGWQVSGIYRAYSGEPLAITGATCSNLPNQGTCMPSLNPSYIGTARLNGKWGKGLLASTAGSTPYIDKQAFMNAAAYTFGNAPRTQPYGLMGPGGQNLDASVRRSFDLWENLKMQFEADMFNVTNSVVFSNPNQTYQGTGTSSFGTLSSQSNQSRDVQLAAKITF